MDGQLSELREMLAEMDIAFLTTIGSDGHLRSRPMQLQRHDPDGTLWFATSLASHKIEDLRHDGRCCVAFLKDSANLGTRRSSAGSWPGTISSGLAASPFIRSCARRLAAASRVCAIGACFSRFSYRYMLSEASTTVPERVCTEQYCDCQVCLAPM